MRHGKQLAVEREYGRPRSLADILQDEKNMSLRELAQKAKLAAKRHNRGKAWNRIGTIALWLVVALTWVVVLVVLSPWLITAIARWLSISAS